MLQKSDGSVLLKLKAPSHRTAGVNQQSHLQRKIGLLGKIHNLLRRLVIIQEAEVILAQITHELAMLVHRDEQNVNFIDAFPDGDYRICINDGRNDCGSARRYIGILRRCRGVCQRHRHRDTNNQAYVLHSQTIQKLHK